MFSEYKGTKPKLNKGIIILAVIILLIFGVFINFYTDYITVKEVGEQFTQVYLKNIFMDITVGIILFVISFLVVFINLVITKNVLSKLGVERGFLGKTLFIAIFSAIIAIVISFERSDNISKEILMSLNSTMFNLSDPIFGHDVAFYIFTRELLLSLLNIFIVMWSVSLVVIVLCYILLYIRLGERTFYDLTNCKPIIKHFLIVFCIFVFLQAIKMFLSRYDVLFSDFATDLVGAGFISDKLWVNYYSFMPLIMIIIAIFGIIFFIKKSYKKVFFAIASFFLIVILVNAISAVVNAFYVMPNEVSVENNYIKNNIAFTKFGYNLNSVIETEYKYNVSSAPSEYDIETLENLRIVDYSSTITATNQLQGLRNYYEFKDMDIGIYNVGGIKKAVLLGARELETSNLDESAQNYINKKFRYTHGYGLVMASLNSVNTNGEPDFYIKDIKHNSAIGVPKVKQPRIYFGEFDGEDVIVNTSIKELDYPEGTTDKEYLYKGDAGIQLTPFNKLLFALKTGDLRMLISGQINSDSRLLINQNVIERLKTAAPFIKFDNDINIVIDDDGSLKWVVDGYTTTDKFPYSQYTNGFNYIRNSVKATVDAYSGDVKLYIIDNDDPIVLSYQKIYPALFEKDEMTKSLKSKIKYPEWLFTVQSSIYAKYHVSTADSFYNKNDLYSIATEKYADEIKTMDPYYNVLKLNEFNEREAELVLMLPFTLYNRENMTSWLAVGNEGDNYGKFIAYRFPKDITVYGPLQVENMIDNNPEISKELTLWNSGGSKVIRGNLLMAPVNNSVLYIEPIYLNSDNKASLPELKRIVAVFGDKVYMCNSLEEAINKAFGITFELIEEDTNINAQLETNLETEVFTYDTEMLIEIYNSIEESSKNGDWESFGASMKNLKEYILNLQNNSVNTIDNQ